MTQSCKQETQWIHARTQSGAGYGALCDRCNHKQRSGGHVGCWKECGAAIVDHEVFSRDGEDVAMDAEEGTDFFEVCGVFEGDDDTHYLSCPHCDEIAVYEDRDRGIYVCPACGAVPAGVVDE